jgi:hypothetical protein
MSKYRDEYRQQQRAAQAAQISLADQEALELMRALRKHTFGAIGDSPRSVAKRALQAAGATPDTSRTETVRALRDRT